MAVSREIVRTFCEDCVWARTVFDHYHKLFEVRPARKELYEKVANCFFHDLRDILHAYSLLQFTKITDPDATSGHDNLTTNYLLKRLTWPAGVRIALEQKNAELMAFRALIVDARRKLIAHSDQRIRFSGAGALGSFPAGSEFKFLSDLQEFVNIAHNHVIGGPFRIDVVVTGDADDVVRALAKSVVADEYFQHDPHAVWANFFLDSKWFGI